MIMMITFASYPQNRAFLGPAPRAAGFSPRARYAQLREHTKILE